MPYPVAGHGAAAVSASRDVPREHARRAVEQAGAGAVRRAADLADRVRSPPAPSDRHARRSRRRAPHRRDRAAARREPSADRGQRSTGCSGSRAATRCCGSSSVARPRAAAGDAAPLARCRAARSTSGRRAPTSPLSQQLAQCLVAVAGGAAAAAGRRRCPTSRSTTCARAAERLVKADAMLSLRQRLAQLPRALLAAAAAARGAVPARARRARRATTARTIDPKILELDPAHPVARRNALRHRARARRRSIAATILPLVDEAPMYGKPHLSIWGEPFAADRPLENMGVRHQGIAASLMPANPYACHNYSLQLAEVGRREESYRWADRATVAAPQFGAAHLDCVRRLRQVGRPGPGVRRGAVSLPRDPRPRGGGQAAARTTGRRRTTPRC